MENEQMPYRGYDIKPNKRDGGYVVSKAGEVVTSQPSLEFARKWIDRVLSTGHHGTD
jgi:hypothetical protein